MQRCDERVPKEVLDVCKLGSMMAGRPVKHAAFGGETRIQRMSDILTK